MTFLENLEPLLVAAERYAELTRQREKLIGCVDQPIGNLIIDQKQAADALLKAAIEFSKWGKK